MPRPSKLELPFDPVKIGGRVGYAMTESGFSLRRLAEDSGVDKARLSRAIRGKQVLTLAELVRICQKTGAREGWIIAAEEPIWADSALPLRMTVQSRQGSSKSGSKLADGRTRAGSR